MRENIIGQRFNRLVVRTAKAVIFHGFYFALNTPLYMLCPFSSSSCLSSLLTRSIRAFLFARWAL